MCPFTRISYPRAFRTPMSPAALVITKAVFCGQSGLTRLHRFAPQFQPNAERVAGDCASVDVGAHLHDIPYIGAARELLDDNHAGGLRQLLTAWNRRGLPAQTGG
jgi:hypothetical protein